MYFCTIKWEPKGAKRDGPTAAEWDGPTAGGKHQMGTGCQGAKTKKVIGQNITSLARLNNFSRLAETIGKIVLQVVPVPLDMNAGIVCASSTNTGTMYSGNRHQLLRTLTTRWQKIFRLRQGGSTGTAVGVAGERHY